MKTDHTICGYSQWTKAERHEQKFEYILMIF